LFFGGIDLTLFVRCESLGISFDIARNERKRQKIEANSRKYSRQN
jgi:hypothetical protein